MSMFETPVLLLLAAALPVLVALQLLASQRRREARLKRMGNDSVVRRLLPHAALERPSRRVWLLSGAACLAGIAAAGPRWGSSSATVTGAGIDIVLALDASLSMLGTDERPSRLERMKHEVRRLRATASGDRFGVIAFAGRSYILSPLTSDEGALDLFIENVDPSVVGQAGSAVSRAILQGTDMLLASQSAGDRALVVMSDWESFDTREEVLYAARRARESGVRLIAVGFGGTAGSRIPMGPDSRSEFKLDDMGRIVTTRHDNELMRAAAAAAGGLVIESNADDKASRIRAALSSLHAHERSVSLGTERVARFQLFLVPALLLVLLDTIRAEGVRRIVDALRAAFRQRRLARVSLAVIAIVPLQGQPQRPDSAGAASQRARHVNTAAEYRRRLRSDPTNEELLYNLGTSLLLADSLAEAAAVLESLGLSNNDELRFRAAFNRGLAQLKAGLAMQGAERGQALQGAVQAYREALVLRPHELDAKWNYELALRNNNAGGGGGAAQDENQDAEQQQQQAEQSEARGSLGPDEAEQILNNAARDEREVQARAQERNRPSRPPGGRDW
jgi:Ca-activated chloride channel family protein